VKVRGSQEDWEEEGGCELAGKYKPPLSGVSRIS